MKDLGRFLALTDFEREARRILPNGLFGYIAGAAEDGDALAANRRSFDDWTLVPRALVDTSMRDTSTELFGRIWSMPVGIAPMGAAGLAAFRADLALARAAAAANVPFVLSSSSLVPMERVIEANPHTWFQLYASPVEAENVALLAHTQRAGFEVLVVTVDVPVAGNREADVRNGYTSPLRPSARLAIDMALHPRWLFAHLLPTLLAEGMPHFDNLPTPRVPMIARTASRSHRRDQLDWSHLRRLRDRWSGKLVVKGLLSADDVERACAIGVDGVVVSNHGGRQLDGAIAPMHALRDIRAAAGAMPLIIDGSIRRGTHVLKAIGAGARFALVGRPLLYAAVVGGEAGVARALAIVAAELGRDLALLGCRSPAEAVERITTSRS